MFTWRCTEGAIWAERGGQGWELGFGGISMVMEMEIMVAYEINQIMCAVY